MENSSFRNLCLFHTLDGLRDGLSHFSGMSRAAIIYAVRLMIRFMFMIRNIFSMAMNPSSKNSILNPTSGERRHLTYPELFVRGMFNPKRIFNSQGSSLLAEDPTLFFTRCGLLSIIRICVQSAPQNVGLNMRPGFFPMILPLKTLCMQVIPDMFCGTMQRMRFAIILLIK